MIESAEEFVRLRNSDSMEEQHRASWEPADILVWREVIANYPDLRQWVAYNKSIPDEIIELLASDLDDTVRSTIACKRRTPPTILAKLAKDPDESVRRDVAVNAKTPRIILESMLDDRCRQVVERVQKRLAEMNDKSVKG